MDMYNNMMPLAMMLFLADDDIARSNFSNMTEAEKEAMINHARDTKSDEELTLLLNELSAHNRYCADAQADQGFPPEILDNI